MDSFSEPCSLNDLCYILKTLQKKIAVALDFLIDFQELENILYFHINSLHKTKIFIELVVPRLAQIYHDLKKHEYILKDHKAKMVFSQCLCILALVAKDLTRIGTLIEKNDLYLLETGNKITYLSYEDELTLH